jgi:transposase
MLRSVALVRNDIEERIASIIRVLVLLRSVLWLLLTSNVPSSPIIITLELSIQLLDNFWNYLIFLLTTPSTLVTHRTPKKEGYTRTLSKSLLTFSTPRLEHIDHCCLKHRGIKKGKDAAVTRGTLYLQTHLCITSRHINYVLPVPPTRETWPQYASVFITELYLSACQNTSTTAHCSGKTNSSSQAADSRWAGQLVISWNSLIH